jgi:large subunit ribosomal protein L12
MNLIYAALLLHSAKKEINEENIKKIVKALEENVEEAKIKALVSALEGVNIEEAISKAPFSISSQTVEQEKKETEQKEEKKEKGEEEAVAGLSSLFG